MIAVTLNFKTIEAARQALLDIPASALAGGPEADRPVLTLADAEADLKGEPRPGKSAQAPAPAAGQATAKADAAPKKTAAASSPAAASAETAPQASTAATEGNAAAGGSTPEAPAASPASSSAPAAVDYPTLQKAVFALAGKSREAAAAVAASFGVKTFKELPEAKWADALAAVQAKTAEL